MTDFKEFWNNETDSNLQPSGSTHKPVALSTATQNTLILGITAITTGALSVFGGNSEQAQAEKFSNEVSNYATSDEVISELSDNVGAPKQDESEDEFVKRASTALREILGKKFNV